MWVSSEGDLALGAVLLAFLGTYLPQAPGSDLRHLLKVANPAKCQVLRLGQGSTWQVPDRGSTYWKDDVDVVVVVVVVAAAAVVVVVVVVKKGLRTQFDVASQEEMLL